MYHRCGYDPYQSRVPKRPETEIAGLGALCIRTKHYSIQTEEAYVQWIRRFILFHNKRHPKDMGAKEVGQVLSDLAVTRQVAASTQNQALSALLFLYRQVLGVELPWLDDVVRAKRPLHLPVVLTRDEVRAVPQRLQGVPWRSCCTARACGCWNAVACA